MCIPGEVFIWCCDAPAQLCQCAKFGVATTKIHKLAGSHVKKALPLWHELLVLLITGYPNEFCPAVVAIGPQSLSRIRPLVWPAALSATFLQGLAHSHVPRATCHQSLRDWHHRPSAVPGHRMLPPPSRSVKPFVLQVPKCLDTHTDTHTNTIEPTFFNDPPEEIFDHNTFNAKTLKLLLPMILN